jgi:Na+/melibiose symporter-like transporter
LIGFLRLGQRTGALSDQQLEIAVGAGLIIVSVVVTCLAADEIPRMTTPPKTNAFFESFAALKDMSRAIRRISIVYFFNWLAMGAFQTVLFDFFGRDVYGGTPGDAAYDDGVSFGMMVAAISYGLTLLYLPFNSAFVRAVGFANTIAVSAAITAVAYSAGFWSTERAVVLAFFALSGLQVGVNFCLPTTMVALLAPPEHFGKYEGALAFFGVTGAEASDWIFYQGIGAAFGKRGIVIGSLVFAALAGIVASRFVIEPEMD